MNDEVKCEFRRNLLEWAENNLRDYSWRKRDRSTYEIFVAEVLLTRTKASMVAEVYDELLARYPSFDELADADPADVTGIIDGIGLHNRRGRALVNIANNVGIGGLPNNQEELQELPYVGPYVASATRCFGFEEVCPIVDVNVYRVYSRLFSDHQFSGPEDTDLENVASEMLPEDYESVRMYNLALLDFGSLICKPTTPVCEECFANQYCSYYRQNKKL